MLALCSSLCSCSSFTSADAKYAGEQIGLSLPLTRPSSWPACSSPRQTRNSKPRSMSQARTTTPSSPKQLGVIAAQQALNAASVPSPKSVRVWMRKQPRNVQPTISELPTHTIGALAVRGRDSSPPITVSTASARPFVPVYAPQVVAMLKAR